ncbi:inverted repeat-binding protein isoform X1 [Haemaphysalis longicornis]
MDQSWVRQDDDESDEESTTQDYGQAVDGILFLIDATEGMFEEVDGETAFIQCLKAARSTMLNKITSSPRDLVGVVLFGTEKDSNPNRFKNVFVLQDLESPGAESVLKLEKLIADGPKKVTEEYGHGSVSMSDVLWTCALMFSKSRAGQRRVLVLTNQDDPHKGSADLDDKAVVKAKDLVQSGIELDLVHLKPPGGKPFRPQILYQNLVTNKEEYADGFPEASDKLEELLLRVRMKDHKKRRLMLLPMWLGPGVKLTVSLYNLVRPTAKPSAVRLARDTNEELLSRQVTFAQLRLDRREGLVKESAGACPSRPAAGNAAPRLSSYGLPDDGEALMPSDIAKTQEYGGRKALFNISEVKQIKALASPGLRLLGFKPLSRLEGQPHVQPSHFIYPDDGSVRGSTRLFSALLQRCLHHRVAPVCYWVSRTAQAPKLVYLMPQEEERDPHGLQMMPPGFHVVQLPFSDDRRRLGALEEGTVKASAALVALAKQMVERLRFTYHPDKFENPELQGFWQCLEALALDRDDVEPPEDYTRPNHEKMKAKAGEEMNAFLETAFPEGCNTSTAAPRKRAQGGDAGAAKKARSENQAGGVDIREEAKAGKLASLTVNVLRDFCKQEGLRCPSKKADIVECIKKHLKL